MIASYTACLIIMGSELSKNRIFKKSSCEFWVTWYITCKTWIFYLIQSIYKGINFKNFEMAPCEIQWNNF